MDEIAALTEFKPKFYELRSKIAVMRFSRRVDAGNNGNEMGLIDIRLR